MTNITLTNHTMSKRIKGLISLVRPKQWIKNAFVFAPLIFTGSFTDQNALIQVFLACVLFCVASSAAYIINDIRDINRDKRHPKKSLTRPLASGTVTFPWALGLLLFLYFILAIGWSFSPKVINVILIYIVLNIAYSFGLKHQPVVDIFIIAIGFVLRVITGAVALAVPVSSWMFVTTLCLALYLASVKRRQELSNQGTESREVLKKYSVSLIDRYAEMSATGALFFYAMFVMSSKPQLVITVPLVLFGLFRYWYVVEALDGGESPTDALTADWQLLLTVGLWIGVCIWALWPAK